LADEGIKYVDRQITDSRAAATRLSDIKSRLLAAIQAGISMHGTLTDKRLIADPVTIQPFL